MSTLLLPRSARPSYKAGFARSAGESASPGLWKGLRQAYITALGPTGRQLIDVAGSANATFAASLLAEDWTMTDEGWAINFDDVSNNDYASAPLMIDTAKPFSIVCRAYTGSFIANSGVFGLEDAAGNDWYAYEVFTSGAVRLVMQGETVAGSSSALIAGQWQTWVMDWDGTDCRVWMDGQVVITKTPSEGTDFLLVDTLLMGKCRTTFDNYRWPDDPISAWSVHDRLLSPVEHKHLHADPLAPFRLRPRVLSIPGAAPSPFLPYFRKQPIKSPLLQM